MEILVGRITKDAQLKTITGDRQVINFSIAVNDNYKTKQGEAKKITRFFNCAYWVASGIVKHLTKGTLVELNGRIGLNTYQNMEGKTVASLTMNVSNIKLHGKAAAKNEATSAAPATTPEETTDDLPF